MTSSPQLMMALRAMLGSVPGQEGGGIGNAGHSPSWSTLGRCPSPAVPVLVPIPLPFLIPISISIPTPSLSYAHPCLLLPLQSPRIPSSLAMVR